MLPGSAAGVEVSSPRCAGPASLSIERNTTYGRANWAVRAAGAAAVLRCAITALTTAPTATSVQAVASEREDARAATHRAGSSRVARSTSAGDERSPPPAPTPHTSTAVLSPANVHSAPKPTEATKRARFVAVVSTARPLPRTSSSSVEDASAASTPSVAA